MTGKTSLASQLQKRIATYSAVGILVVGVVVALTAILPLYHQLTKATENRLLFEARTRSQVVEEFLLRIQDVAMQVASRTKAREMLEALNQEAIEASEFLMVVEPILNDALGNSGDLLGITRLDASNRPVLSVGMVIPAENWVNPDAGTKTPTMHGPITLNSKEFIVVGAPILNRQAQRVGTDIALFGLNPLKQAVTDYTGLKETGEMILGGKRDGMPGHFFPLRHAISSPEDHGQYIAAAISQAVAGKTGVLDDEDCEALIAFSPVEGSAWAVLVRMAKAEVYASIRTQVIAIMVVLIALIILGVVGMFILLRPLSGRVILHTHELQEKVNEQTAALEEELAIREEAEQKIRMAADELARSNEALDQYAYVASHDLKEPLRKVVNYLELLQTKYGAELDERAGKYIQSAVDSAGRMKALIDDLLIYSKVNSAGESLEPVDLGPLFDEIKALLDDAIRESGVALTHGDLPEVKADRTQLRQLLQNLVHNAIKYRNEEAPAVHLEVTETDNGEAFLFSVKDNGIGIAPQFAERIFQPFRRLHDKSKYPGTGIGLAICESVVQRHGGRMWVESEAGKGSNFLFTWPK